MGCRYLISVSCVGALGPLLNVVCQAGTIGTIRKAWFALTLMGTVVSHVYIVQCIALPNH
jgi:hypothetical protein